MLTVVAPSYIPEDPTLNDGLRPSVANPNALSVHSSSHKIKGQFPRLGAPYQWILKEMQRDEGQFEDGPIRTVLIADCSARNVLGSCKSGERAAELLVLAARAHRK